MKLLLDIPFAKSTVQFLRERGYDAIHVIDRLPANAPDHDIVALASMEERVILCFDLDFARIVATSRSAAPSILTFRTTGRGARSVERALEEVIPLVEADLQRGALVTVDDFSVRIRSLPIAG
ncbi:MAG: DUF5615 family PIN-like protein [Phycisphaeraceae bacterium]|nr:DUF5615 family PIN-like protein [Phycisphaeraceae bacterium]